MSRIKLITEPADIGPERQGETDAIHRTLGHGRGRGQSGGHVRQLVADNHVDRPVYDRLIARHGKRWLVELTATVGQYQYIACVLGAFEVQPGPDRERIRGRRAFSPPLTGSIGG
jgi:hypothetical protein